jgi:hypothetical protein
MYGNTSPALNSFFSSGSSRNPVTFFRFAKSPEPPPGKGRATTLPDSFLAVTWRKHVNGGANK